MTVDSWKGVLPVVEIAFRSDECLHDPIRDGAGPARVGIAVDSRRPALGDIGMN